MLYFAYDASHNGDCVAHYALRLAAHGMPRELRLVRVEDGLVARERVERRIARLREEAERAGVSLQVATLDRQGSVAEALGSHLPSGREHTVICGLRARHRNLAFLGGTVSQGLLAARQLNVLAIRVVSPGLLGHAPDVVLPIEHDRWEPSSVAPILRLLAPDLRKLHVLLVNELSRLGYRFLTPGRLSRLRREGDVRAERIETEVLGWLGQTAPNADASVHVTPPLVDGTVVISDDMAKEVVISAAKLKCQLVLMQAVERVTPMRIAYGDPVEQVLRRAPCDVAIYRGPA